MRTRCLAGALITTLFALAEFANAQTPQGHEHILRKLDALSTVPVPTVPNLNLYIRNKGAAIALGKALFWDMNAGSDGKQACATCHFNAGADSRAVNQVSPGLKQVPNADTTFQIGGASAGPNYHLQVSDFPIPKSINDVISSAGVHASQFTGVNLGNGIDSFTPNNPDPDGFNLPNTSGGNSITRKVEPRNTPSVINAVYNYRNFWDGRAQNDCNFLNPFGARDQDPSHHLYQNFQTVVSGKVQNNMATTKPTISNSSLCSQALGPVLSPFEMSANGRTFWDLGVKMLSLQPLSQQLVALNDSRLGTFSSQHLTPGAPGLKITYQKLIQQAFQPVWWDSPNDICVLPGSPPVEIVLGSTKKTQLSCPSGWQRYTQAEYNFSLFWGLSIQMYESLLRSDQSKVDKFLLKADQTISTSNAATGDGSTRVFNFTIPAPVLSSTIFVTTSAVFDGEDDGQGNIVSDSQQVEGFIDYSTGAVSLLFGTAPALGDPISIVSERLPKNTILTPQELLGMQLFQGKGKCSACHSGPEMTNASVATVTAEPLERMLFPNSGAVKVYDDGFYNTGVRETHEDPALAGNDGFNNPLSMSSLLQDQACADPSFQMMLPARSPENIPAAPLDCQDFINSRGNFKAPTVRGVELTAPYFHNGGQLTLLQLVDFYNRGGDFFNENIADLDPDIEPLGLTQPEEQAIVAFMMATTDVRVKYHRAPFDHPSLTVSYGSSGGNTVTDDGTGQSADDYITIPAVGSAGYQQPLCTLQENINGFRTNGGGPCP
jgi:cytochrome c peroxidase